MKSEVAQRIRARFDAKPWHYKAYIKFKVRMWFAKATWRHYWRWCTSKSYRLRYGNCTFFCDACYRFNWAETHPYCKNNPKCTVKKAGVYVIEI